MTTYRRLLDVGKWTFIGRRLDNVGPTMCVDWVVGRSSPYCKWGKYCCLTMFFPIVDMCPSCKDIARQSCAMVPRCRIFMVSYGIGQTIIFSSCHRRTVL